MAVSGMSPHRAASAGTARLFGLARRPGGRCPPPDGPRRLVVLPGDPAALRRRWTSGAGERGMTRRDALAYAGIGWLIPGRQERYGRRAARIPGGDAEPPFGGATGHRRRRTRHRGPGRGAARRTDPVPARRGTPPPVADGRRPEPGGGRRRRRGDRPAGHSRAGRRPRPAAGTAASAAAGRALARGG